MKWMKLHIPDRLHKNFKQWAVLSDQNLNDAVYYLFDNLPKPLMCKPNQRLLDAITNPTVRKSLSEDTLRLYELIGLGLVRPTPDEVIRIKKITNE